MVHHGRDWRRAHPRRILWYLNQPQLIDDLRARLSKALAPTFQLHRELEGGGMSRVFVATEQALGREVVIKALPADLLTHESAARFNREIRTAARLQHPNIVPVLSAGEADGVPYYTMPYVSGASLRERLNRGSVPLSEASAILQDIARALSAAHALGVVHRDIKPENVLLSQGAAVVTDFGIARALSEATGAGDAPHAFRTATGIAIGTPAYMAPEQFAADPSIDHRADIYAFGIVAFELLTGRHPYQGVTGTQLLQAHMTTVPPSVHTMLPDVPMQVAEIIAQCLEKDPARRPHSASQITNALTVATGVRGVGKPMRFTRVGVSIRALAAVGAVLVAAVAYALWPAASTNLNEQSIAIAPFRVRGAAEGVRYLREGVPDLMTPQLQAIPRHSSPGMRVFLERWRRAAGSIDNDLDVEDASTVAANVGAGRLIMGTVVGNTDSVTINAELVRVSDRRVLASAKETGSPNGVAVLATRLVAALLSINDGATMDMVRSVVSASPQAITPFLAGEQAYRRGHYVEAARAYSDAWQHDTTFALAALRIETVNGWSLIPPVAGPWLRRAWTHRTRLRGADSILLVALAGSAYPAPISRRRYHREIWQAALSANSAELWQTAGDQIFHDYQLTGDTTSWTRALEAFRTAEALDSSFAPALEHQANIHLVLRDTAAALAALARQRKVDSMGDFFLANDAMVNAILSAESGEDIAARMLKESHDALPVLLGVLASPMDLPIAPEKRRIIVETIARQWEYPADLRTSGSPEIQLQIRAVEYNTGRPIPFALPPGADSALVTDVLQVLAGMLWSGDSATSAHSAQQLRRWASTASDTTVSALYSTAHFTAGLLALDTGDTVAVERARASLRSLRAPPNQPWRRNIANVHEQLLEAHLLVARNSPRARDALVALDTQLIDVTGNSTMVSDLGNLLVSRLWEEIGDDERAWRALQRRSVYVALSAFLTTRLEAEARIAERLGNREQAIRALRMFVGLRANAVPSQQAAVREAQARLARLEARSRGQ